MYKKSMLFIIMFFLIISLAFYGSAKKSLSDWIVTGQEVVENDSIVVDGNLIVKAGGSLILRNVTLRMNVHQDGEYRIAAEPGASLSIYDCDIASVDPAYRFLFIVDGAKFVVKDSELRGIGHGLFVQTQYLGLSLMRTEDAVIEDNTIYHERASGIALERSGNTTIRNNKIIHLGGGAFGIHVYSASDNLITGNTLIGHNEAIVVQKDSWNNSIINNTVLDGVLGIVIRHGAGNNVIQDNKVGELGQGFLLGLWLDKTPFPNIFMGNVVRSAQVGAYISYASNAILANNTFSDFPDGHQPFGEHWKLGSVYVYRSYKNHILNNDISGSVDGGITLLFSSDNVVRGNRIAESKFGIGMWYGSDRNTINNNMFADNSVNIIIEKSNTDTVSMNHFAGGDPQGYDSGDNVWGQNFWSDYTGEDGADGIGDVPYQIRPNGVDPEPLIYPPDIQVASIPEVNLEVTFPELLHGVGSPTIEGETVWENEVIEYKWGWLNIGSGASLTLRNVTLIAASNWVQEPIIFVKSGGALFIHNSEIIGQEHDMPLSIVVEEGGKIIVKNSILRNLGWFPGIEHGIFIQGNEAVIENNQFHGCFVGISLIAGSGHRIVNNTVSRGQFGIVGTSVEGSIISGNKVYDIAHNFDVNW